MKIFPLTSLYKGSYIEEGRNDKYKRDRTASSRLGGSMAVNGWVLSEHLSTTALLWQLRERSMPDRYNTLAPGSRNNREYRPRTALTPTASGWKSSKPERPSNPNRPGAPTAAERRVLAKARTGKNLTLKERALLEKLGYK